MAHPAATIKILNTTGRGEIINFTDVSVVALGFTLNSSMLAGHTINTLWTCEIEVTGKGSRKIRSMHEYVEPIVVEQIAECQEAPQLPQNTIVSEDSVPVTPVTPVATITPVAPSVVSNTIYSSVIAPIAKTLPGLDFGLWNSPNFYVAPETERVFATAYSLLRSDSNRPIKLMLTGGSGDGKSSLAEQYARFVGLDFLSVNCATMRDVNDWFRQIWVDAPDGASVMTVVQSEFAEAIQRGNCVICLDEFNRVSSDLHNSLFPILDDRARTTVDKVEYIVGPNVTFVGTINQGYKHNATAEIDDAMLNRFDMIVEVQSLPYHVEVKLLQKVAGIAESSADLIVKVATAIRDNRVATCSTRSTLSIARMVAAGLGIFDAFDTNMIRRIPIDNSVKSDQDAGNIARKNLTDTIRALLISNEV